MTLETKLGGDEMGFLNKHKKKIVRPLVAGMIAIGVLGGVDKNHDRDINFGTSSAVAAQGMQASVNFKLPGAIAADPDWAVHDAWGAMKTGRGNPMYNLYGKNYAMSVLRLDSDANVGTQFKKVDEITMKTSHAFYLTAAKLNRCGSWLIDNYLQDNPGLKQYALGLRHLYSQRNKDARKHFAYGIFAAASVGARELGEAENKSIKFINADVNTKEIMLREAFAKFEGIKVDHKSTDVNSMSYKLKDAYWNLGMLMRTGYKIPDETAIALYENSNGMYHKLKNEFKYATCTTKIVE